MSTTMITNDPSSDFTANALSAYGPVTVDWDPQLGDLTLTFDNDLTDEQKQEVLYIVHHTANERTLRQQAQIVAAANRADISTNDAFLNNTSPTNAQILEQVRELTRQSSRQARMLNGLARLVLRQFDGTD